MIAAGEVVVQGAGHQVTVVGRHVCMHTMAGRVVACAFGGLELACWDGVSRIQCLGAARQSVEACFGTLHKLASQCQAQCLLFPVNQQHSHQHIQCLQKATAANQSLVGIQLMPAVG